MAIQREREIGYWAARPIPEVIYSGDLNKKNSPYNLQINASLLGELFKEELDMTSEQVSRTKVAVIGKGGWNYHSSLELFRDITTRRIALGSASIFYDRQGRYRAAIYPDNIFTQVKKARSAFISFSGKAKSEPSLLNRIREGASRQKADSWSKGLLTTGRLLPYLEEVDNDRLSKFLDKILPEVMERYVLSVLSHEAEHVSEAWNDRLFQPKVLGLPLGVTLAAWLIANEATEYLEVEPLPSAIITYLFSVSYGYTAYLLTGAEQRAHKAAKELKSKSRWADVVTFSVNRPWDEL